MEAGQRLVDKPQHDSFGRFWNEHEIFMSQLGVELYVLFALSSILFSGRRGPRKRHRGGDSPVDIIKT